ncbi:hypothetical protein B0H10DRAFT_2104004 [Mycena sp. CBHHK59/15]|nr:hypothetical protein B0H10DRAFT_2104004 [Mycena sp. CBHHK59/15]
MFSRCDPSWITQTHFLLVTSLAEDLELVVYDHHTHRKQSLIGMASFNISRLIESGMLMHIELPILKANRQMGDLLCSLVYYPILPQAIKSGVCIFDSRLEAAMLTLTW